MGRRLGGELAFRDMVTQARQEYKRARCRALFSFKGLKV